MQGEFRFFFPFTRGGGRKNLENPFLGRGGGNHLAGWMGAVATKIQNQGEWGGGVG